MRHGTDQEELGRWFFNDWLERAMADGTLVPAMQVQVVEGGIEGAQKVLDMLKGGGRTGGLILFYFLIV